MIVSHKYKFIFIKTKKTAGTSLEILLSKYCGNSDIITPISEEDEAIRKKLGYKAAQNYKVKLHSGEMVELYSHANAQLIKKVVGEEIWASYYKFCFERNPWEKVISFYYWEHKHEPRPSIGEFLYSKSMQRLFYGKDALYRIENKIEVDKVYKFENLNDAIEDIFKHMNISVDAKKLNIPKAKTKYRKDQRPFWEILSRSEREYIAKLFEQEIQDFYPNMEW